MKKETKSVFKESFAQGMGSEIGKKTGLIVFGIIVLIISILCGILVNIPSSPEQSKPVKISGTNGNIE